MEEPNRKATNGLAGYGPNDLDLSPEKGRAFLNALIKNRCFWDFRSNENHDPQKLESGIRDIMNETTISTAKKARETVTRCIQEYKNYLRKYWEHEKAKENMTVQSEESYKNQISWQAFSILDPYLRPSVSKSLFGEVWLGGKYTYPDDEDWPSYIDTVRTGISKLNDENSNEYKKEEAADAVEIATLDEQQEGIRISVKNTSISAADEEISEKCEERPRSPEKRPRGKTMIMKRTTRESSNNFFPKKAKITEPKMPQVKHSIQEENVVNNINKSETVCSIVTETNTPSLTCIHPIEARQTASKLVLQEDFLGTSNGSRIIDGTVDMTTPSEADKIFVKHLSRMMRFVSPGRRKFEMQLELQNLLIDNVED